MWWTWSNEKARQKAFTRLASQVGRAFYSFPSQYVSSVEFHIIVKANLSSFNIKFNNYYSLSASTKYRSITWNHRGSRRKGYLAGELLCSLVSQAFKTTQMKVIPLQCKLSLAYSILERMTFVFKHHNTALHRRLVLILLMWAPFTDRNDTLQLTNLLCWVELQYEWR